MVDSYASPQPAPASLLELPNAIQSLTPTKVCVVCGQSATHRCSRCRIAVYCSLKCQEMDWTCHSQACIERKPSMIVKRLDLDDIEAGPLLSLLCERTD